MLLSFGILVFINQIQIGCIISSSPPDVQLHDLLGSHAQIFSVDESPINGGHAAAADGIGSKRLSHACQCDKDDLCTQE